MAVWRLSLLAAAGWVTMTGTSNTELQREGAQSSRWFETRQNHQMRATKQATLIWKPADTSRVHHGIPACTSGQAGSRG